MKRQLRWPREMEANHPMGIITKIENFKIINTAREILEEELALKMILMEISSIWEKDSQKLGDFIYISFKFININSI